MILLRGRSSAANPANQAVAHVCDISYSHPTGGKRSTKLKRFALRNHLNYLILSTGLLLCRSCSSGSRDADIDCSLIGIRSEPFRKHKMQTMNVNKAGYSRGVARSSKIVSSG